MKVPSEFLFDLIKSMTPSEKVYFVKFSSRHVIGEENNYIKLFHEINNQKHYDEKALLKKFAGKRFTKQFSAAKNYLINEILRALENYHTDDSIDSKISNLISQYKILYKKTLFTYSANLLKRAKNLAIESERYTKLIEIINYEKNFDYMKLDGHDYEKVSLERFSEEKEVLKHLENISEYNLLYLRFTALYKKIGIARNKKDVVLYRSVMKNKLLTSERFANSVRAKNLFYITNYLFSYATGNFKKAYDFGLKRLNLIENNPKKISAWRSELIYALSDVIALSYNMGNYSLCLQYLKKLRDTADKFKNLKSLSKQLEMYLRSFDIEINIYCVTGYFREGIKLIPEVTEWLDKYRDKMPRSELLKIYYAIAYLFFGAGDYEKSLEWINKILNDKTDYRLDYKAFAGIINIVIHYEFKNFVLLEYNLKSLKRYLSKREKIFKYEESVMKTFSKLIKYIDASDVNYELNKLQQTILKLNKDEHEKLANEFFDMITWVDSKLQNVPFEKLVRQKSKFDFHVKK